MVVEPPAVVSEPAPVAQGPSATEPAMVRRSWYLARGTADGLAAVVDDLHHETRKPRHEVLAAIVATALGHLDEARGKLAQPPRQ